MGRIHGQGRRLLVGAKSGSPDVFQLDHGPAQARAGQIRWRGYRTRAGACGSQYPSRVSAPCRVVRMAAHLKVFGLNCSLKSSKDRESSSTDTLMQQLFGDLAKNGATGKILRAADYNIK